MSSIDSLLAGIVLVANIENLLALAVGIAIGIIGGAIPGMSATTIVALTVPFTFRMPAVTAILLLLGVYKGSIFGGSIPAILIRTPGNVASSATVIDGYPMAQSGQSARALGTALWASCTADLFSNLALILAASWLAALALEFGPTELFTLVLFSLIVITGVAGRSVLFSVISVIFGLLLATVGLDPHQSSTRFTFGNNNLVIGVNYIAVTIGLSAISEILRNIWQGSNQNGQVYETKASSWYLFSDFRRCIKSVIRGSFIGVIFGSIPGIGAAPSAFLSYSEARRTSKNKENFGKGEVEGVAAAEAGNSGVAGATLIPLLALGIPGDMVTAVLIGAFSIHSLQAGPQMFVQNSNLIYGLFVGLIVSSVFLFGFGSLAIKGFRFISKIPRGVLTPIILVLCIYGVYATKNNVFDIAVMFFVGFVGFIMGLLKLPTAPFLIAFTLGPLLEQNFGASMSMTRSALISRPWTWFFLVMIVITVIAIVRTRLRLSKEAKMGIFPER